MSRDRWADGRDHEMQHLLRRAATATWASLAIGTICVVSVVAQERAPLPDKVVTAQTIYLSNDSGDLKAFDAFYSELRKWGRFKIVTSRTAADLVAVLTTTEASGVVVGTATATGTGNVATASGSAVTIPRLFLQLKLLDAASGESVWSDTAEKWMAAGHAPSKLVDNLKSRLPKPQQR